MNDRTDPTTNNMIRVFDGSTVGHFHWVPSGGRKSTNFSPEACNSPTSSSLGGKSSSWSVFMLKWVTLFSKSPLLGLTSLTVVKNNWPARKSNNDKYATYKVPGPQPQPQPPKILRSSVFRKSPTHHVRLPIEASWMRTRRAGRWNESYSSCEALATIQLVLVLVVVVSRGCHVKRWEARSPSWALKVQAQFWSDWLILVWQNGACDGWKYVAWCSRYVDKMRKRIVIAYCSLLVCVHSLADGT